MTLKHISPEEFKVRLDKLASENPLVDQLINKSGNKANFQTWPDRLKNDAYSRMGLILEHDALSGITNFRTI